MRPDEAHRKTDKRLAALERRIAKLYGEAGEEIGKTIAEYFEGFRKRDEEMRKLIGTELNGREWTEADYKQWRLNQIARGKRFEALRDRIAERMTEANAVAVSYCNDETPGIYSLNRNYTAYTIEQVSDKASFDLWDEQTVKRLIAEQPELMPYYPKRAALRRGIDLEYGRKQIAASVTSGILQGKSIGHIADDLQARMTDIDRASAIRTARTAVTGAQNAGRMDSYAAAQKMGIKLKREWVATLDNRTRHAHAMLDGQQADIDKPFKVDGYEIMFPGDKSAPGYLVYNCRCTLTAVIDGVKSKSQRRARDPETGENVLVEDMTYQEWEKQKKALKINASNATIPIRRDASQGKPSAISTFGAKINTRQKKLLDSLPEPKTSATVRKKAVSMKDLSALTAYTGQEFAMFTRRGERLIIRGTERQVLIDADKAAEMIAAGYKWSGHTHPGTDELCLIPSEGDLETLGVFNQRKSVIYDSLGRYGVFEL